MANPNLPKFTPEQSLQYRAAALAVRHAQREALAAFSRGDITLAQLMDLAGGIKVQRVLTSLVGNVRYFGPAKLAKLAKTLDVDFFDRRLSGIGDKQALRLKELTDQLLAAKPVSSDEPF